MRYESTSWFRYLVTILVVALAATSALAQLCDDSDDDDDAGTTVIAIAKTLVPANIVAEVDPMGNPLSVAAVQAKLDAKGAPFVVAAYGDMEQAIVRVIKVGGSANSVAYDVPPLPASGRAHIDAVDVDGDGTPEIVAGFATISGPAITWVFKWNGTQLVDISPEPANSRVSLLRSPIFEPIDGSGKLQAINSTSSLRNLSDGGRTEEDSQIIYALEDGIYKQSGVLVFFERLMGGSVVTRGFHVNRPDAEYRLFVVNGDASASHFASSVAVFLNGTPLQTPVGKSGVPVAVPVTLMNDNTVKISVAGGKAATCLVGIELSEPTRDVPLKPLVDCVWHSGSSNGFVASFGYSNDNGEEIWQPRGESNAFSGSRPDRGQPTLFDPGEHHSEFWVQSLGEALTWTLDGISASATLSSPPCQGQSPIQSSAGLSSGG